MSMHMSAAAKNTLRTLALGATFAIFGAVANAADYIGNEQCKVCHNKKTEGEQWNIWKAEKHASAMATLSTDKAKELAAKKGVTTPPAETPECVRCHTTAYDVATKAIPAKLKLSDSVQCEQCHGPGSEHQKDGKILLFQKDKAGGIDPKANLQTPDVSVCVKCHNPESASWDPNRYTKTDGTKDGFDFEQAYAKIAHQNPLKKKDAAAPAKE